jgi:DNA-binding NarL/FixJ family response regulator
MSHALQIATKIRELLDALVEEVRLAEVKGTTNSSDLEKFRVQKGRQLTTRGVAEVYRLFAAGLSNAEVALKMRISLSGAIKRRTMYNAAVKAASVAA